MDPLDAPRPEESTVFQSTPFGKYTLLRKVGRGGMGVVYEALDTVLNRRVAVKLRVSSPEDAVDGTEQERFLREARLSAALPKHAHIVSVYEAGAIDGRPFLAMEFVDGVSFGDWRRGKPLRRQLELLRLIAEAVHHAHEHGVVHRDLKPANILVDAQDRPHVTDFGLAKSRIPELERSITTSGVVVGTPAFMSPEQAQGARQIDGRSDVFTLGTMLYEMLSGRLPFEAETAMLVLVAVIEHPAVPPSQVRAAMGLDPLDARLEAVCLTALAKNPDARYPSARAFADALGRCLETPPPPPQPPAAPRRRLLPLGALAAALLAFLAFAALPARPPAPRAPLPGPSGKVMAVAFAPGLLAAGGAEKRIRLWSLPDGRALEPLEALSGKIEALAVSPDGRSLAAVTEDPDDADAPAEAVLWDLPGRKVRLRLDGHPAAVNAVAFSRDGRRIATGDRRGTLRVWDAGDGRLLHERKAHQGSIRAVAFGPSGGLATASWDRSVRLWEADGRERAEFRGFQQGVWALAVSPDGTRLATGDSEGKVRLWDVGRPGKPLAEGRHAKEVSSVAFAPSGKRLVSGSWDRKVTVWDVDGVREVATLAGHADAVWGVAWSPDGLTIASAGLDGQVRLWPAPR
jgi:tRNA A-37 threonylcarbamoyl transferase component Bud32